MKTQDSVSAVKTKEAAKRLSVTPKTIRALVNRGLLKPNRQTRHLLFRVAELGGVRAKGKARWEKKGACWRSRPQKVTSCHKAAITLWSVKPACTLTPFTSVCPNHRFIGQNRNALPAGEH